jgi:hypothetical protein
MPMAGPMAARPYAKPAFAAAAIDFWSAADRPLFGLLGEDAECFHGGVFLLCCLQTMIG